jgi:hypothetical protein
MERVWMRGLVVPSLLVSLVREGRWVHPGDAVMARVIPWFRDPPHFCGSVAETESESRSMDMFADDPYSGLFREVRGGERGPGRTALAGRREGVPRRGQPAAG